MEEENRDVLMHAGAGWILVFNGPPAPVG